VWVYDGLTSAIKVRHYSPKTLEAYQIWTQKFQTFTQSKDPRLVTMDDVKGFLSFLAVNKKVAASSQNQAFNALLFLFRHVLEKEFGKVEGVVRAKRKPYIPVVLSREEVDRVIAKLDEPYALVVKLLYGCGLRLFECLQLRVQDLNFAMRVLTVHDGKGQKDRTVPLPEALVADLQAQLERVAQGHEADLAAGYAGTFLPAALGEKYPRAARELPWQWLFPSMKLTLTPDTQEYRRYHLHETLVQKSDQGSGAPDPDSQTGLGAHLSPQLRQPFVAGELRYSHHSGIAGAQRCAHHDDLYQFPTGFIGISG
jgi:integron integrase